MIAMTYYINRKKSSTKISNEVIPLTMDMMHYILHLDSSQKSVIYYHQGHRSEDRNI
jgi:hypothetical protein